MKVSSQRWTGMGHLRTLGSASTDKYVSQLSGEVTMDKIADRIKAQHYRDLEKVEMDCCANNEQMV